MTFQTYNKGNFETFHSDGKVPNAVYLLNITAIARVFKGVANFISVIEGWSIPVAFLGDMFSNSVSISSLDISRRVDIL